MVKRRGLCAAVGIYVYLRITGVPYAEIWALWVAVADLILPVVPFVTSSNLCGKRSRPFTWPNAGRSGVVEVNVRHVISFGTAALLVAPGEWWLPIDEAIS